MQTLAFNNHSDPDIIHKPINVIHMHGLLISNQKSQHKRSHCTVSFPFHPSSSQAMIPSVHN